MTDISVIILVGQEKLHMRRCLEKLAALEPRQIFVVESQPDDGTHEVALEAAQSLHWCTECLNAEMPECLNGASPAGTSSSASNIPPFKHSNISPVLTLVFHKWPGLQSSQFNWALENLPIQSSWILRLDADEYLTAPTISRLHQILDRTNVSDTSVHPTSDRTNVFDTSVHLDADVAGLTLELRRRFCGGEIRHATNGIRQVRLFRFGKARYAETLMDERLEVDGKVIDFDGAFYDDNLNSMDWWRAKHRGYAKREAQQALAGTSPDPRKAKYYKLPPYLRAVLYFGIRYFLKLGILDGYAGWMWNFWQGLWYRWIVDREIARLKSKVEG